MTKEAGERKQRSDDPATPPPLNKQRLRESMKRKRNQAQVKVASKEPGATNSKEEEAATVKEEYVVKRRRINGGKNERPEPEQGRDTPTKGRQIFRRSKRLAEKHNRLK